MSQEKLFYQSPDEIKSSKKRTLIVGLSALISVVVLGVITVILLIGDNTPEDKGGDKGKDVPTNSTTRFKNDYKIVGYYPNWHDDFTNKVQWDKLTHVLYAFGIPSEDGDGTLIPLENIEEIVDPLVDTANEHGVIPMISIGGWSYFDKLCSELFEENTNTTSKIDSFSKNIVREALKYGFKGIDIDWEYPTEESKDSFVQLILKLRKLCDKNNLLLTSAVSVLNGEGYTKEVVDSLDFINIMAYDGDKHANYSYIIDGFKYWNEIIGVPINKIIIGVPFYSRPNSITYDDIISANAGNSEVDECIYNGNTEYYNGIPTMKKKSEFAAKNAGGMMIWELSQDTHRKAYSLLNTIYDITVEIIGLEEK